MKKQLFYLIIIAILAQGCDSCTSMKVHRTVSKSLKVSYNFNINAGESKQSAIIYASSLYSLFVDVDGTVEKIDISGVSLSGEINPQQNTATQTIISAVVTSSSGKFLLLKETKLIKTSDSGLGTDLIGSNDKSVSFNNAVNSLNEPGLTILRSFLSKAIQKRPFGVIVNQDQIEMEATSFVPASQRLVGTVYIKITASVTYYKCEPMAVALLYNDEECSN